MREEYLERLVGKTEQEASEEVLSMGMSPMVVPHGEVASKAGVPDGTVILWMSGDGTVSSAVALVPDGS